MNGKPSRDWIEVMDLRGVGYMDSKPNIFADNPIVRTNLDHKQTEERIPLDIKNPDGSIRLYDLDDHPIGIVSEERIPVQPEQLTTTLKVTEADLPVGRREEDEDLLNDLEEEVERTPEPESEPDVSNLSLRMTDEVDALPQFVDLEVEETEPVQPVAVVGPEPSPAQDEDVVDAGSILQEMTQTFKERGAVYGKSYIRAGELLKAMIPEGVVVETAEDFATMAVLGLMAHKMCRALNPLAVRSKLKEAPERKHLNLSELGHQDSIHDLAVYTAIWEELFLRGRS